MIQVDTVTTWESISTTNLSGSHTCNSGTVLYVMVMNYNETVSATYNGVAMTAIGAQSSTNAGRRISFFKLLNPAQGSNTLSATQSSSNPIVWSAMSILGTGGLNGTPSFRDFTGLSNIQVDITTTKPRSLIFGGACFRDGFTDGNASGFTTINYNVPATYFNCPSNYKITTDPGTFSDYWGPNNSSPDTGSIAAALEIYPYLPTASFPTFIRQ